MAEDIIAIFDDSEKPEGAGEIERRVSAVAAKIQAFNFYDSQRREAKVKSPTLGLLKSFALKVSGPINAIPFSFLPDFPYDYRLFQAVIGDVQFPKNVSELPAAGLFSDVERKPLSIRQLCGRTFKSGYRPTTLWLSLRKLGLLSDNGTIVEWSAEMGTLDFPLIFQGVGRKAIGFDISSTPYALFDFVAQARITEDFITVIEEEIEIACSICELAAAQPISWDDFWFHTT